ncbi:hypothetical protein SH2C18_24810 [Clostridium sediminicola]|uniref:hypothetical protein n=1 Tax=Clostridium sediminicola TaxID=3114879 RepID=UPI0031F2240E
MFEILAIAALGVILLIKYSEEYREWLIKSNYEEKTNEVVYLFFKFRSKDRFIKFSYIVYILLFITLVIISFISRLNQMPVQVYIAILMMFFIADFIAYNIINKKVKVNDSNLKI